MKMVGHFRKLACDIQYSTYLACRYIYAYNYNTSVDVANFAREAKHILNGVESECRWMYETLHTDEKTPAEINYTVWSDVFLCPECVGQVVFFDVAVDHDTGRVKDTRHYRF